MNKNQTQSLNASVIGIDQINDLALLKVPENPKSFLKIEDEDVNLLQDVIVAGFPRGREFSSTIKLTTGSITSLAGEFNNFSEFQTDAIINKGNSGGPIINEKGNVMGMMPHPERYYANMNKDRIMKKIVSSLLND